MPLDATSASGKLAEALEKVVRGLAISPAPTQVARRKRLAVMDGDGSRVILIEVADSESFEPVCNGTTRGTLLWAVKYPCGIALGYANGGRVSDNADLRKARGQIEDAVTMGALQRAGLVGSPVSANDVAPSGRMIFDLASTPGVDWSVMTFTVECLEDRPYGI